MIGVICDSGADLPQEIYENSKVKVVPLKVVLGEKVYKDGIEISEDEVLEFMEKGFPKTSLPTKDEVTEALEEMVNEGYNEIIGVNISSALSGTHNIFRMAFEEFAKVHENVKIGVVDSLNISMGTGFLVYRALLSIDEGKNFEETLKDVKDAVKKSKLFYTIPTLKFLKAGGRIGKVSATMGEILNLKPVISVDDNGVYYTVAKARGMERAVGKMITDVKKFTDGKEVLAISFHRSGNDEKTLKLVERMKEELKHLKVRKIFTKRTTPVLLVHVGRGLVGVGVLTK